MSRGGKREGAGRPRRDLISISIRVPQEVAEIIKQKAIAEKKSQGDVIAEAVTLLFIRQPLGNHQITIK